MNEDLEALDGLCAKIIEQRDRIWALEAALREILEPFEEGHQTAFDIAIAARIRTALTPEQDT